MTTMVWINVLLAVPFIALWAGIPLWLVLKRPDARPQPAAGRCLPPGRCPRARARRLPPRRRRPGTFHPGSLSRVRGCRVLALSIACTVAAVAWLYLLAGHGGYWRTSQRLPRVGGEPDAWPDVVAVVPARNEAEMLPVTLPALLGQEYPGALTVIVVDDGSSDGTGEVAARIAAASGRPLRVIAGTPPPDGERWAGKVWAMAQGLRAAGPRPGPDGYLLFTDADIAWEAQHAAPPGGRGGGRRPGPGLADGPAAGGHRLGARRGPRLRLLLRPALPVPAGERARLADGRRGGRLHAGAPPRPGRAAWRRSATP